MSTRFPIPLINTALLLSTLVSCSAPYQGVSENEIKIGTWAPLTGPASALSDVPKAMQAYVASVNAKGGVHGRKITLIVKDDAYDPARTPDVVKELVEQEKVLAIVGGIGTANGEAVMDYLFKNQIPWVSPGSGTSQWTVPVQGNIFTVIPSYITEGRVLARYALRELRAKKVSICYQEGRFGAEGMEGARLGMGDAHASLAASVSYKVTDTDLSQPAAKLKASGADTVILFAIPAQASRLVQEFARIGFTPRILASQALADPVMFELAGASWEGAVVASGVLNPSSDHPQVQRARVLLKEHAPDLALGTYALDGLGWAEILVQGLEKVGPELNRVKLIYTLESFESTDNFFGRPIRFSQNSHEGLHAVRLMKAEGGKLVDLADWTEP